MRILKYAKSFVKYTIDPNYRFLIDSSRGRYDEMPDDQYLQRCFRACMGEDLHLDAPKTFNEKLQWLKLYDRKPEYTIMVDKYKVREYIKEKIGDEYLIPLLGVWDNAKDIDFDKLPNQFVLKCNHNSGLGMYICKDKSKLTKKQVREIRKNLTKGLQQDYYLTGREWPYKNVPRKIIAEKYMEDETGQLRDYKFYCFNGEPKIIMINSDREIGKTKADYFDMDFHWLDFKWGYDHAPVKPLKPKNFEKMKEFAAVLSKDIPELRVDFYEADNKIYFGELTFFDGSGFDKIEPKEWDDKLGEWIVLPEKSI